MLNIKDFGEDVGSGNPVVDTNAFVAAIAALPKGGATLFFPAGLYQFNRRITLARKRVVILGEGKGLTPYRVLFVHGWAFRPGRGQAPALMQQLTWRGRLLQGNDPELILPAVTGKLF